MWDRGRLEEGLERMDRSYQELSQEEPDADLAALAAQLGRFLFFAGRHRRRDGADRVRARARRGARAPGDVLAGAQHEGDSARVARAAARRARTPARTPSRSRSSTTSRRRRSAPTSTSLTRSRRPTATRKRGATVRDGLALRTPRRQPLLGAPLPGPDATRSSLWASGTRCARWRPSSPRSWEAGRQAYSVCR